MRSIETYRKQLRLTRTESRVYEMLLDQGPMRAADIALGLDVQPQAAYRWLNALSARCYVVALPGRPRLFQAVPPAIVMRELEQVASAEMAVARDGLLDMDMTPSPRPVHEVSLVYGRQALYDRYVVEAGRATTEILAYTIGIAYDAQLQVIQEEVRARGVEVRHVVQRYTKDNYHIVRKWLRIGVKMRHNPAPAGFHLLIFDGRTALLTLSDPQDTEQRTTMVLRNPAAVQAMRGYFYAIWAGSRLVR